MNNQSRCVGHENVISRWVFGCLRHVEVWEQFGVQLHTGAAAEPESAAENDGTGVMGVKYTAANLQTLLV